MTIKEKNLKVKVITIVLSLLLAAGLIIFSGSSAGREFWQRLNSSESPSGIPTEMLENPLAVYFLDVGKADSIIIRCDDKNILIDAGTYEDAETVEVWLKKLEIERLDIVFATHPDSDHIGGMAHILGSFEVGELVKSNVPRELTDDKLEYRLMISAAEENGIPIKTAEPGGLFDCGKGRLEILGPVGEHTDTNNYSLVQKLTYGNRSILFCGDIEERAEKKLRKSDADLTADVIKVAHHGSKTSSSKKFLRAVDADYAVISTGPDNNKLPYKKVLERLEELDIEIYRTDLDGTVMLCSDGEALEIITENEINK